MSAEAAFWTCGTLGKVHGLHGELYLNPAPGGVDYLALGVFFFVTPAGVSAAGVESSLMPCTVARAGGTYQHPILRLNIAASREEAIRIQGWELLAAGGQLDELPHYTVGELLDAEVRTNSGVLLGTVSDVLQAPAHELLEIAAPSGRTLLVPLVDELVAFDVESRQVRVADGLLDEEAEG